MVDSDDVAAREARFKRTEISLELLTRLSGVPFDRETSAFLNRKPGELELKYDHEPPPAESASGKNATLSVGPQFNKRREALSLIHRNSV